MKHHAHQFSIRRMAQLFGVSPSSFYAWLHRCASKRECQDNHLLVMIKTSFKRSRESYGYRRIHADLKEQGEAYSRYRVERLMRENNIRPKTKRQFKVTTQSTHNKPIHDNYLERQFHAAKPNQCWVSDITYIPTLEGWSYLVVIMDLFSRKIIGWEMVGPFERKRSHRCTTHGTMSTQRALRLTATFRSWQPICASDTVQKMLFNHGIQCSMSRAVKATAGIMLLWKAFFIR